MKNLVDINPRIFKELSVAPGEWGYYSLNVGTYPPDKLAKIKSALPLPTGTRAIVIDAGYSVRGDNYRGADRGTLCRISTSPTARPSISGWAGNSSRRKFFRTSVKRSSGSGPRSNST